MSENARRTGPALEAMSVFLVWLVPTIEEFLLGDRIQSTALVTLTAAP